MLWKHCEVMLEYDNKRCARCIRFEFASIRLCSILIDYIRFYFHSNSILFESTRSYSVLFHYIRSCSSIFDSVPFYSILFNPILLCSVLFDYS